MAKTDSIDSIESSENQQPQQNNGDLNSLICAWLEYRFDQEKSQNTHTLHDEKLSSQKQKRIFGKWVACIAMIVPLIILVVLSYQLLAGDSVFHTMKDIPQSIVISASFLSFIVIYTVLIKGMFEQKKEEENQSPVKEAVDILREYRSHDSP